MGLQIRQENEADHPAVAGLIKAAFEHEKLSDQQEHLLVERLRRSPAFIPELSLVAVEDDRVVGYILLSKVMIQNDRQSSGSLALAPVAVLPSLQKRGIGGKLIREAHRRARELGHSSIVLLGHAQYYPRFGYKKAVDYEISFPFEAPAENCLVLELQENALSGIRGTVVYPDAFFGGSEEQ